MTLAEYCELTREEVSDEVVLAAAYLQAKGLEFCVDFGTENAAEMADFFYSLEVCP